MRKPTPVELEKHLAGARYPVSKADLVAAAVRNDAPIKVIDALQRMSNSTFDDIKAVHRAVIGD